MFPDRNWINLEINSIIRENLKYLEIKQHTFKYMGQKKEITICTIPTIILTNNFDVNSTLSESKTAISDFLRF